MAAKTSNPWAVSVRVKHYNSAKTGFQIRHDFRIGDQPKYVDGNRLHLNSGKARMDVAAYRDLMLERRDLTNPKRAPMMARAAIMTGGIITFGHLAQAEIEALDAETQDRMYDEIADRVAEVLGNDVTGLASHRDEEAPHAHFQMPARRGSDGKLMSEVLSPKITSQLQDEAAKIAQRYAPKIQRGEKKENTKARNKSVKELHRTEAADLEAKQEAVADLEREIEGLEAKAANHKRLAEKHRVTAAENAEKAAKALKNAKTHEKRAKDAHSAAESVTERLEALQGSVARLEARESALQTSVAARESELETVESAVAQKKTKIASLESGNSSLRTKVESWSNKKADLLARLQSLNAA